MEEQVKLAKQVEETELRLKLMDLKELGDYAEKLAHEVGLSVVWDPLVKAEAGIRRDGWSAEQAIRYVRDAVKRP